MPAVTPETAPLSVTEVSQRIRLQSLLLCKLAAHLCRTSVQLGATARAIRQTSRNVWQHRALVRVAGKFVRKYTLRHYPFFFKEIQAKSGEFSTPS